jgi:hypothetical protein
LSVLSLKRTDVSASTAAPEPIELPIESSESYVFYDSRTDPEPLDAAPPAAAPEATILVAPVTWEPVDGWIVPGLAEIDDELEGEPLHIRRMLTVAGLLVPPGAADYFVDGLVKYALDEMLSREPRLAEPHPYRESRRSWRVKSRRRCVHGCACVSGKSSAAADAPCDCIAWRAGGACACGQPEEPRHASAAGREPRRIEVHWLFDDADKLWPATNNG